MDALASAVSSATIRWDSNSATLGGSPSRMSERMTWSWYAFLSLSEALSVLV